MYITNTNCLGYVPKKRNGFSRSFRKALNKWYLSRDPLLTTEQIVRHKSYDGWTHKCVMKLLHTHSDDPCNLKNYNKLPSTFIILVTIDVNKL